LVNKLNCRINAQETHEQVSFILRNYPRLIEEFAYYIPVESKEEKEPITSNFDFAMTFVQSVRTNYAQEPEVYSTFLGLLKDYQMGKVTQTEVVGILTIRSFFWYQIF
jgi:histone deacetylase complex regulatory component SIN3